MTNLTAMTAHGLKKDGNSYLDTLLIREDIMPTVSFQIQAKPEIQIPGKWL